VESGCSLFNFANTHVYKILAELAPHATTYLGIGVQEGVCVRHVVEANPSINLILCDTWGPIDGGTNRGSHAHIDAMLKKAGHLGTVRYLNGRSQEEIPKAGIDPTAIDLAFVDGAHGKVDAYEDLLNTWPLVKKFMVVHDTFFPGVEDAVSDWLEERSDVGEILTSRDGTGTLVVVRGFLANLHGQEQVLR
jgi:hypothetical protein